MFTKKIFTFALLILSPTFTVIAKEGSIKIGIIAGPSVQIMEVAKKVAKEKYNLDIEPVVFTDYIMPNEAVNSGDVDINIFQTASYLNRSVAKRYYQISSIGNTFIYPMGIYSKKIKNISELKENSAIAIPSDSSNQGRALLLLSNAGLIKLNPKSGEFSTLKDITENPKNLKISTLDAAQLPRIVPDVEAVVLNNDFVDHAGFKPNDALVQENPKTAQPYINVIVVKTAEKNKKEYAEVVDIMHSKEVLNKNLELYPGAVKAW